MTHRREEHGSSRKSTGASLRLSPPPRIERTTDRQGESNGRGRPPRACAGREAKYWLTLLVFLGLGAAAVAVFALLPRWVAERNTAAEATIADAPPAAAPPAIASEPEVDLSPPTPLEAAPPVAATTTPPRRALPPPPPVAEEPAQSDFARAMASGLQRLEQGDLEEARSAFQQAQALSPGSPEAADGIARVEAARQLVAIGDHRERAGAFEKIERWDQAAAEYESVLALDPTIRFAQQGQRRSAERHSLGQRLRSHIARPDRLSSDRVLADARTLLAEAGRIEAAGPVLLEQMDRLRQQVQIASTPLRVVLLSDNLTEVTVYKVGRLGLFERRELDLRPGSYVVVGTRTGFRDVRHRLEVKPGGPTPTLAVRCEEAI